MLPFLYKKINDSLKEDNFKQEYLYAEDTDWYIEKNNQEDSQKKEERGVLIFEL
jgi:hypothetical protein